MLQRQDDRIVSTQGSRRFYETDDRRSLPPAMVERIRTVLGYLESAGSIEDMNKPSLRLHPLRGELKGYWAVTVRANWRIIFRFVDGRAFDVDFVDYH
jgi:proteic killer suppression protein